MWDIIRLGFLAIVPPTDPALERHWRVSVAVFIGGLTVTTGTFVSLAFGLLPVFGFIGFAQASDVASVTQQVQYMRIDALDQQLLELKEKQCDAQDVKNYVAARSYGEKIYERAQQYQTLTHNYPHVLSCEEL